MFTPRIEYTTKQRLEQLKRDVGGAKYVTWRKYVLERDGNKCQWNGCNSNESLQVHHINRYANYLDLRYNTYNGITLCASCHKKTFGKEGIYAVVFTKRAMANEETYQKNKDIT